MRRAALICLVLAALTGGFAWWGLFTPGGIRAFDAGDGVIPVAAGLLGALLAMGAAITWGFSRMRRPDS